MNPSFIKQEFRFNDFDRYALFVKQAELHHSQLSKGVFKGSLIQLVSDRIILSCHRMNQTILQEGTGIKDFTTFLLPGNLEQDFNWRKSRLRGNVIGILKSNMEHSCVTLPNFLGTPVSIENDYLYELSEGLGFSKLRTLLNKKECFEISVENARQLHSLIQGVCINDQINSDLINFEIPRLIIQAIAHSGGNVSFEKGQGRSLIFQKARDIIHANAQKSMSIIELCKEIGVSERNLRYAFKERTNLSPKRYMMNYKLNEVRKKLKSAKSGKVFDFANEYDYWHSGQFSAEYQKLFGEFPSDTLTSLSL